MRKRRMTKLLGKSGGGEWGGGGCGGEGGERLFNDRIGCKYDIGS
jgi:hypothetical protein